MGVSVAWQPLAVSRVPPLLCACRSGGLGLRTTGTQVCTLTSRQALLPSPSSIRQRFVRCLAADTRASQVWSEAWRLMPVLGAQGVRPAVLGDPAHTLTCCAPGKKADLADFCRSSHEQVLCSHGLEAS